MSRLQPATTIQNMYEILDGVALDTFSNENRHVQFRPRTTGAENGWQNCQAGHLVNLEDNNYRMGPEARIYIDDDGNAATAEGHVTEEDARRVVRLARAAHRSGKAREFDEGDENSPVQGGDGEFSVAIYRNGGVRIGCERFTFEEINTFAKQQGW